MQSSEETLVYCNVETCAHWIMGNLCGAENIDILNELPQQMSEQASQTMCKTFQDKRTLANIIGAADNVNVSGALKEPFLEGEQLHPSITCTVASCKYWEDGNVCVAKRIDVDGPSAQQCAQTQCATFAKR